MTTLQALLRSLLLFHRLQFNNSAIELGAVGKPSRLPFFHLTFCAEDCKDVNVNATVSQ